MSEKSLAITITQDQRDQIVASIDQLRALPRDQHIELAIAMATDAMQHGFDELNGAIDPLNDVIRHMAKVTDLIAEITGFLASDPSNSRLLDYVMKSRFSKRFRDAIGDVIDANSLVKRTGESAIDENKFLSMSAAWSDALDDLRTHTNAEKLRNVARVSYEDIDHLLAIFKRTGRPKKLKPLTVNLAKLADKVYMAAPDADWRDVAVEVYSRLHTMAPDKDVRDMIDWFNQIERKSGRHTWGKRLNEYWNKWQK